MKEELQQLLKEHATPKDWDELSERFYLQVAKKVGDEPVYEFFYSLDDSLEVIPKPIALSVNPYHSYVPYHLHNFVEMIIPIKGSCTLLIGREKVTLAQGDIIMIGPYTAHRNLEISEEDLVVNIALKNNAFSISDLEFMRRSGNVTGLTSMLFFSPSENEESNERYMVFHSDPDDKIMRTVHDIIEEYYHPDTQSNQIIRFELLSLFSRFVRALDRHANTVEEYSNSNNSLLSFLLYIEKNYATVTLEDMGQEFGFNPSYLSTYLKKQTGKSFIKLVHLQRINVAADFLRYSKAPIEQIATKVGYENPSYFYKIFKKTMGMSPAAYREQN